MALTILKARWMDNLYHLLNIKTLVEKKLDEDLNEEYLYIFECIMFILETPEKMGFDHIGECNLKIEETKRIFIILKKIQYNIYTLKRVEADDMTKDYIIFFLK